MSSHKIENLASLLSSSLGPNCHITNYETGRLTAPGENYGSLMLSLRVELEDEEKMELVAKVPPPNDFLQEMFNTPVTFRNEIAFYRNIVPRMDKFLREEHVEETFDCFPKFYGGRNSLESESVVDGNGVLLLENLKVRNFQGVERTVGFDLEASLIILDKMAKFHAIPLGMRLKRPEEFRKEIIPFLAPYKTFDFGAKIQDLIIDTNLEMIAEDSTCEELLAKIRRALEKNRDPHWNQQKNTLSKGPFSTIIHTDAWVNNFMVQYDENNVKPIDCKLVDFQLYEYGNPARDLVFFIFTSVQTSVINSHYHDLVQWYHKKFIEYLTKMKCDITPFGWNEFSAELAQAVKQTEFAHVLQMLEIVYLTEESSRNIEDVCAEDISHPAEIPQERKERVRFVAKKFDELNWI